mmetsp:Transcript_41267/g.81397  ORF Transcript_41267/g.81397 Transcript_41267/m.81397 type:complete len:133 (+) Transcript_41267:1199-1597(+)
MAQRRVEERLSMKECPFLLPPDPPQRRGRKRRMAKKREERAVNVHRYRGKGEETEVPGTRSDLAAIFCATPSFASSPQRAEETMTLFYMNSLRVWGAGVSLKFCCKPACLPARLFARSSDALSGRVRRSEGI